MTRAYIRYVLTAPLSILFKLFCWMPFVAIPSALFAAAFNLDRLPPVWNWIMTHNDDIYGSKTRAEGKHVKQDLTGKPDRFFDRLKLATWWLYRNNGYGFDAFVLGLKASDVADVAIPKSTMADGYFITITMIDGRKYFSYLRDYRLTKKTYLKLWFGWHYADQAGYHKIKVSFSPKGYEA